MISFNSIPINIRVPGQYIEIDNTKALKGLNGIPTKVLVIGQKLTAGTQAPLVPVLMTSADQAKKFFGQGSQLAHMLESFKKANSFIEVWAIAQVDNAAGVQATGTVAFSGTATAAGTQNVYIGGRRVQFAVTVGMTAALAAVALANATAALPDLPVTASASASTCTFTARHKGVCANDIDIRVNYYADDATPAGLTVSTTAMTGGTGNPDVNAVLTAIGDEWYTDFVMSYTDTTNIAAMETELADRFGPLKMIDGHLYISLSDTHANLVTKGQARNSPHVTMMGVKGSPTPSYEISSALGAIAAYSLNIDPARPLQTLTLTGVLAPAIADRFDMAERNILLFNGISTFRVDAGGLVVLERVITTYRQNPFGAADSSYLDVETMKTLAYLRYDIRVYIALRYPRYKLADDGTKFARGQAVVTPKVIRASLINRFGMWEEQGLVENITQFKEDLIVERDSSDPNRINALIPPDIINQFRVFAAQVEFRL